MARMKGFLISFCFLALLASAHSELDPRENLEGFLLERFSKYRDVFATWLPDMINAPTPYEMILREPGDSFIQCDACKLVIDTLKFVRKMAIPDLVLKEGVILVCQTLQIVKNPICRKVVNQYANTLFRIVDDKMDLTATDVCGVVNYKCGPVNGSLTDWETVIDPIKPELETPPLLDGSVVPVKIMHLTDVHLDLFYKEGMDGKCGQPAGCCHEEHGEGSGDGLAGKYGHFACSLARPALDALYEHASTVHGPLKYIYLTGDYVYSAVWENSVEGNSRHIEYVTTHIAEVFEDTPVFPVIGNHEANTCNCFPPESLWSEGTFDLAWLYQLFSEPFMRWIPADQLPNIRKGGYYTVRPDDDVPFRIVVLNTNLCYTLNFWLVYETTDVAGQLQWFADTMLAAEQAGEYVHIVGHIPPGSSDCWNVYSDKFDQIVKRFEGIIQAQFYGHIHREYFNLAFDGDRPFSASYPGPSVVPSDGNTAYKIFYADGARGENSTWEIMDHETWILNLTLSNELEQPEWSKLYGAKEDLGLESMRPDALYDFVQRMVDDDELFQFYLKVNHKASPQTPTCTDNFCKRAYLCEIVTASSGDETPCKRIQDLLPLPSTPAPTNAPVTDAPETEGPKDSTPEGGAGGSAGKVYSTLALFIMAGFISLSMVY